MLNLWDLAVACAFAISVSVVTVLVLHAVALGDNAAVVAAVTGAVVGAIVATRNRRVGEEV